MTPVLRRSTPLLLAVALVGAGCGSPSQPRSPAAPQPATGKDAGRVTAMAVAPPLGTANSFAVLGGSTVTNTGPTVVNGDLGVSPGAAITGFPPGIVNGTTHAADATALNAQNDETTAFNNLAGQACDVVLTGIDLGGLTLTPGTYCFASSAQLTGTLTLNGLGNPGAVFVFQIGTALTTASGSRVRLINGAQSCGVFWQIGSSATLGTATTFRGNVFALASITLVTGATNTGALFAQTGAVTLDSNVVSRVGSCGSLVQPPPPVGVGVPALPPVAGFALLLVLLAGGAYALRRA